MRPVSTRIDLTGQQFGEWTVLSYAERRKRRSFWLCRCSCGTEQLVEGKSLRIGGSSSCRPCGFKRMKQTSQKHGHSRSSKLTPTYVTWRAMKIRCLYPKSKAYKAYGGRGITVCERWLSFENFLADMGERPEGMSLDRYPNTEGNYEPGNCRWATRQQQAETQRHARLFTIGSDTKCLSAWCREFGIDRKLVSYRLKRGWSFEKALTTAPRK